MKKVFVLLLSVAVVSFGLIGCKSESKPKNGGDKANATDKADSDHPEGEHPEGEKADGEHPEGEHPTDNKSE